MDPVRDMRSNRLWEDQQPTSDVSLIRRFIQC